MFLSCRYGRGPCPFWNPDLDLKACRTLLAVSFSFRKPSFDRIQTEGHIYENLNLLYSVANKNIRENCCAAGTDWIPLLCLSFSALTCCWLKEAVRRGDVTLQLSGNSWLALTSQRTVQWAAIWQWYTCLVLSCEAKLKNIDVIETHIIQTFFVIEWLNCFDFPVAK